MIKIEGNEQNNQFDVRVVIASNKLQEIYEVSGFLQLMIKDEPALLNAVLDSLMSELTESTYNMDPEIFEMYTKILEGIG